MVAGTRMGVASLVGPRSAFDVPTRSGRVLSLNRVAISVPVPSQDRRRTRHIRYIYIRVVCAVEGCRDPTIGTRLLSDGACPAATHACC